MYIQQPSLICRMNMNDMNKTNYFVRRFPIFIYHSTKHDLYGMPIHGNSGFKIGVDAGGPFVTAETRTFTPDPVRENNCIDFLKEVLPTVSCT